MDNKLIVTTMINATDRGTKIMNQFNPLKSDNVYSVEFQAYELLFLLDNTKINFEEYSRQMNKLIKSLKQKIL